MCMFLWCLFSCKYIVSRALRLKTIDRLHAWPEIKALVFFRLLLLFLLSLFVYSRHCFHRISLNLLYSCFSVLFVSKLKKLRQVQLTLIRKG